MEINIDLTNYKLTGRLLFGDNLKIIFQNVDQEKDKKVLEIMSVAGFIDYIDNVKNLKWLIVKNGGGSYSHDLSLRLRKEEIINNKEAFIFIDDELTHSKFRCSANKIDFRNMKVDEFG